MVKKAATGFALYEMAIKDACNERKTFGGYNGVAAWRSFTDHKLTGRRLYRSHY